MPAFLDFLFPFGRQVEATDFHFSGFRSENRLTHPGPRIDEFGRSGLGLQQCYNLKGVERSDSNGSWEWSIRQTAVYHSFDQISGRSFWLITKGNRVVKDRMVAAKKAHIQYQQPNRGAVAEAFELALESHLIFCGWAQENWRWYINYLDECSQKATKRTTTAAVGSSNPLASFSGAGQRAYFWRFSLTLFLNLGVLPASSSPSICCDEIQRPV